MEINGSFIDIKKEINETEEQFIERTIFIGTNITNFELDKLIDLSKIYRNMKFIGCHYSSEIDNIILELMHPANLSFFVAI
jgi:hypothetical protein